MIRLLGYTKTIGYRQNLEHIGYTQNLEHRCLVSYAIFPEAHAELFTGSASMLFL